MKENAGAGGPVERSLRVMVHSHAWLALGAAAQVWFTVRLLPLIDATSALPVIAALATFSAYGAMRLARVRDAASGSGHLAWFDTHRTIMLVLCPLSAMLATLLFFRYGLEAMKLVPLLVPAVVLYILPSRSGRATGLRYVPFLKLFLIAGVWSGVAVAFPFLASGDVAAPFFLPLLIERGLFVLAITLPFDIRDLHYDPDRERTIPKALGLRSSKAAAVVALLASLFIVLYVCQANGMIGGAIGVLLGYAITALLIMRASPGDSLVFYGLFLDGTLLLIPGLWWLGEQVGNLAGG